MKDSFLASDVVLYDGHALPLHLQMILYKKGMDMQTLEEQEYTDEVKDLPLESRQIGHESILNGRPLMSVRTGEMKKRLLSIPNPPEFFIHL